MFWRSCRIVLCLLIGILAGSVSALERDLTTHVDGKHRWTLKTYNAPNGAYTARVPAEWKRTWSDAPSSRTPSELELALPAKTGLDNVTISIFHYAGAHQTPEKYLFELLNPKLGKKEELRSAVMDVMVGGIAAKALDVSTHRYPALGLAEAQVPSFIRYVVVPARKGFFVLRYDVPESQSQTYRSIFDLVVNSFAPAGYGTPAAQDPISAGEYEVYAALFHARVPGGPDAPQFFDSVPECRLVYGQTMPSDKSLDAAGSEKKDFGFMEAELVKDYLAKNQKVWQLTDRIMVPNLQVLPPEEDANMSSRLWGKPEQERGLFLMSGGFVTLSRVGFDRTGDTALFRVALTYPGSMRAKYVVLMQKREGVWELAKAAMEGLIIH